MKSMRQKHKRFSKKTKKTCFKFVYFSILGTSASEVFMFFSMKNYEFGNKV